MYDKAHAALHHRDMAVLKSINENRPLAEVSSMHNIPTATIKEIWNQRAKVASEELKKLEGLPGFSHARAMKSAGWTRTLR